MTRIIASSVAAALLLIAGGPALAESDVDGRDFLAWQRGGFPAPGAPKAKAVINAPAKQKANVHGWDYKKKIGIRSLAPSGRVAPRQFNPSRRKHR